MYPVSLEYQDKIKENNRIFKAIIQIQHSTGVLDLTDKDIALNTLNYTESSQAGEEFTIGSTVASDISFTILNKPEYDNIQFMGARVACKIKLFLREGIDAHFVQPSQPSKMPEFSEDLWEEIPLGRFKFDSVKRLRNTIELKAIDNMINLDKPYSLSKLSYPATLYQIYVNACNVCDIPVGTNDFPNKNYIVQESPSNELTFRDIIGYVAELSGTFAKCNRDNGALKLRWYEQTDIEIGPQNRFNFKASDDVVQIKGIIATTKSEDSEEVTYIAGTDEYAIDLTENPLLQGNYEIVLPNILTNVEDTIFTPYTSDWQGNPALQAGDITKQIDIDGKEYNTLVTKSVYKYRGKSILEAKGLSELSRGYKGSTDRRIAQIKKKIDEEVGDKLTTLEQAQLNATEMIANMLGGYIVEDKENGILYIADNPNINLAMKVWKYGINGFGYSSTGKDGPYTTAVTADGSIVAMLVSANIITANMVQTGLLSSEDGSTWLNLDNGTFNLKDKIKFVNNKFNMSLVGTDASTEVDGKINSAKSEIKITTDEISGRVSNVQTDIGGLGTRMSSAESKITPSAITNTVESTTTKLATKAGVTSEIGTAKSTMEQYADGIKSTVESNVASTYETKSGVTSQINSAKSTMEQYADGIVSTVRTTANSAYSKADSAQSTANSADSKASTAITNASTATQTANDVSFNFTQLKNLSTGQELSGGRTTINRDGIKVTHTGLGGQYSEVKADGFVRKWRYGEAKYLNDVWIGEFNSKYIVATNIEPGTMSISLPMSFKGRSDCEVFLIPNEIDIPGNRIDEFGQSIYSTFSTEIVLNVDASRVYDDETGRYTVFRNINWNSTPPMVEVNAYKHIRSQSMANTSITHRYEGVDFLIIVIGR